MSDAPTLVVLAAGIGSRYGGLKQMDPVGPSGEFLVDYTVYDAVRAGFGKVVFVIRRDIEDLFRSTIGARVEQRVPAEYVLQDLDRLPEGFALPPARTKPWGTGHAVLVCREAVEGPFAVVNADDFYGRQAYEVLIRFLLDTTAADTAYGMVGFPLRNTLSRHGSVARGICRVEPDGRLAGVVEHTRIERLGDAIVSDGKRLSGAEMVSLNIWGLKSSVFEHLSARFRNFLAVSAEDPGAEFFLPTVINVLVARNLATVRVLKTGGEWFGVTYPEDKPVVTAGIGALIRKGEYPDPLWGG